MRHLPGTIGATALALLTILGLSASAPANSRAQGWIVDAHHRPTSLVLDRSDVDAVINHHVATVRVSAVFQNTSRSTVEGHYLFPLPEGASVSSFSLEIDGKAVAGEMLPAEEARRTYETIVRNALDPALLEWVGGGLFKARVFPIAAGASRTIALTYDAVLPRTGDVVRFVHPTTGELRTRAIPRPRPIRSATPGGRIDEKDRSRSKIHIRIESDADVRNVYSPSHAIDVDRSENRTDVAVGRALDSESRSLVLYYSLSRDHLAATFITHRPFSRKPGYFMLMLDPPVQRDGRKVQPRDIVFVLDTSGSMAGDKIRQAKDALLYAVKRLGPQDRFGIVAFSSDINVYSDGLAPADERDDALYFVEQLEARGGTNIDGALQAGLRLLDGQRTGTVVFLTDGLPSTGVVNINDIRNNAESNNRHGARIFSFGVGYDVNTDLLDGISRSSSAFSDYILPEDNIEERISSFYERVRFPVMTDIEVNVRGVDVSALSPRSAVDLFLGDALILTGRYESAGSGIISVSGMIDGKRQTQEVDVNFPRVERESAFVARVWATRRIGELLESIRLEGENRALVDEVVALGKEFGLVTPYTSYLVTEDEARFLSVRSDPAASGAEESKDARDVGFMPRPQREQLSAMEKSSGRAAIEMSKQISNLKQASVASDDDDNLANVLGQTFIRSESGAWKTQSEGDNLKAWNVQFGSQAYFLMSMQYPEVRDYLKLGNKVSFVFRDQLVVVGESGVQEIDAGALKKRFGN